MSELGARVPSTPGTVADRLRGARRRRFVGRSAELELFRGALEAGEPPFSVLWVHGPGGVGKTMLLGEFAEAAAGAAQRAVAAFDLRGVEPSPPAFLAGLARALGVQDGTSAMKALVARRRPVVLLDTFEVAVALEDWLREAFVPSLPADALVVVASRRAPGEGWRREPGWRELLRVVSLRNLTPADARCYLRAAGVAEELHDRVLEVTHGHPLALTLLVEVLGHRDAERLELAAVPDVLDRLVTDFLSVVPTARHRSALELSAHARFTTEDLVRSVLDGADAGELFAWLRSLTFAESGPYGVFPHDLARDVINADLQWRDPAGHEDMHRRIRRHVVERIKATHGREHERAVTDLIFLHRRNPVTSAFWDWDSLGHAYADAVRPGDGDAILAMTERHESRESAAIAAHWLDRQPGAFVALRGRGAEPVGYLAQIELHAASEEDLARDPGAKAAWEYAQRHGPLRPGNEVVCGRFFMDRDAYQSPSPAFNVVTSRCLQEWVGRSALSWYMIPWADPDAGAGLMGYVDFERVPAADFEVGGRRYGVFARDWRRGGAEGWLDLMGDRELGAPAAPADAPREPAAMVALSQPEFAAAVRDALRNMHRPAALARNSLLSAQVVADRAEGAPGPEALAALLREAVAALDEDPRADKLVRALDRTYLRPAQTQEAAAELLGLPFSTYRGHLARAIDRVVEWLWQRELYGPAA